MAQERCVRMCRRGGRLWKPGEVRTAKEKDEHGRPVASEHFRLVESDERVDAASIYDEEELRVKRREVAARDKSAAIRNALDRLDPDNDRHWTAQGLPNVAAVATMIDGFEVTRAMITAVAPDFERKR